MGASIGSLNGWAIAGGCDPAELSGRLARAAQSWKTSLAYSCKSTQWSTGCGSPACLDSRLHAAYQPRVAYGVVVTDIWRMEPRLFTAPEVTWQHLAASCAIFGVLPQIRHDGRFYTDGGLLEALPLWAACQMGATDILAINVLPSVPGLLPRYFKAPSDLSPDRAQVSRRFRLAAFDLLQPYTRSATFAILFSGVNRMPEMDRSGPPGCHSASIDVWGSDRLLNNSRNKQSRTR